MYKSRQIFQMNRKFNLLKLWLLRLWQISRNLSHIRVWERVHRNLNEAWREAYKLERSMSFLSRANLKIRWLMIKSLLRKLQMFRSCQATKQKTTVNHAKNLPVHSTRHQSQARGTAESFHQRRAETNLLKREANSHQRSNLWVIWSLRVPKSKPSPRVLLPQSSHRRIK